MLTSRAIGLHVARRAQRTILIAGLLGFVFTYPTLNHFYLHGFQAFSSWTFSDLAPYSTKADAELFRIYFKTADNALDPSFLRTAQSLNDQVLSSIGEYCFRYHGECVFHNIFDVSNNSITSQDQAWQLLNTQHESRFGISATMPSLCGDFRLTTSGPVASALVSSIFLKPDFGKQVAEVVDSLCGESGLHCSTSTHSQILELRLLRMTLPQKLSISFCYLATFVYLFISFYRMRLVRSRIGLATATLVSVVMSVFTAYNILQLLGGSVVTAPQLVSPFTIILIETENMFRLTSAVTRTPGTLSPAKRVALGLSRAGPQALKATLLDLIILSAFWLNGESAFRRFCAFQMMAITFAWILHMTFFVAILSIDMRRLELQDLIDRERLVPQVFMAKYFPVSTNYIGSLILTTFLSYIWLKIEHHSGVAPAPSLDIKVKQIIPILAEGRSYLQLRVYQPAEIVADMIRVSCRSGWANDYVFDTLNINKTNFLLLVVSCMTSVSLLLRLLMKNNDSDKTPVRRHNHSLQVDITQSRHPFDIISLHNDRHILVTCALDRSVIIQDSVSKKCLHAMRRKVGKLPNLFATDELNQRFVCFTSLGGLELWKGIRARREHFDCSKKKAKLICFYDHQLFVLWQDGIAELFSSQLDESTEYRVSSSVIEDARYNDGRIVFLSDGRRTISSITMPNIKDVTSSKLKHPILSYQIDLNVLDEILVLLSDSVYVLSLDTLKTLSDFSISLVALPRRHSGVAMKRASKSIYIYFKVDASGDQFLYRYRVSQLRTSVLKIQDPGCWIMLASGTAIGIKRSSVDFALVRWHWTLDSKAERNNVLETENDNGAPISPSSSIIAQEIDSTSTQAAFAIGRRIITFTET